MTEGLAFEGADPVGVRYVGEVEDADGDRLSVAVCGGLVLIGAPRDILGLSYPLDEVACEEFAQLFVRAQWMAAQSAAPPSERNR